MISAYGSLPGPDGISAYHWQIAIYVAWFANLTHLTALVFLRKHFHEHPAERGWRIVAMLILFCLVLVGQVPTASFNWNNTFNESSPANASAYARCFFDLEAIQIRISDSHEQYDNAAGISSATNTIVSVLILFGSFLNKLIKTSKPLSALFRGKVRRRLRRVGIAYIRRRAESLRIDDENKQRGSCQLVIHVWSSMSLFLTARFLADLLTSTIFDVGRFAISR
jgi:hypothetical protein